MLLSPIQNTGVLLSLSWTQKRPRITQVFGGNPQIYNQFGTEGHGGIDYGGRYNDHNIFAPMAGKAKVVKSNSGYGNHIYIRDGSKVVVVGHLSEFYITDGDKVHVGDKIGKMGNTGFSTATHLHYGLRFTESGSGDVFKLPVKDTDNGFNGWVDPAKYTITWILLTGSKFISRLRILSRCLSHPPMVLYWRMETT